MSIVTQFRNAKAAEAAINNERVTRQRVDNLESWAGSTGVLVERLMSDVARLELLSTGSLWVRLKWLLFGEIPPLAEPSANEPATEEPRVID